MLVNIWQIENKIRELLQADAWFTERKVTLAEIPALSARADKESKKQIQHALGRPPAIATYTPGGVFSYPAPDQLAETMTVHVICAGANSRCSGAAMRGDGQAPGAWDLVDNVRRVLSAQTLPFENLERITLSDWGLLWASSQGLAFCNVAAQITLFRQLPPVIPAEEF